MNPYPFGHGPTHGTQTVSSPRETMPAQMTLSCLGTSITDLQADFTQATGLLAVTAPLSASVGRGAVGRKRAGSAVAWEVGGRAESSAEAPPKTNVALTRFDRRK